MSANYTCNQFDSAYKPTRLGNWEVPKWHLNRPKGRSTVTKVIANDRGHLLPGVQKADQKHWAGLYLGTYQLPKRITKEIAMELSNPKCQTWMRRSYHHPFIDRSQENKNENNRLENINGKEANEEMDKDSIKSIKSAIQNEPTLAADISMVRNCVSADGPLNSTNNDGSGGGSGDGREGGAGGVKTPSSPALSRISAGNGGDRLNDDNDDGDDDNDNTRVTENPSRPPGRRYGDAHRHHGLPDAIEDAVYRSLQTKRHKHPGLGLSGCWPKCSAVAYKSFNDPGPTQCSKLRVYRPKTSSSAGDGEKKESVSRRRGNGGKYVSRPKTCVPVVTAQQLTDIKLALCWDLDAPFDRNQPRRPPDEPAVFHKVQQLQQPFVGGDDGGVRVGGSNERKPQNSSAVMGFVQTVDPATVNVSDEEVPDAKRMQSRECLMKNRNLSAVMELIPNKDRENGCNRPEATADTERNNSTSAAAAADRTVSNKPSSSSSSTLYRNKTDPDGCGNNLVCEKPCDNVNRDYGNKSCDDYRGNVGKQGERYDDDDDGGRIDDTRRPRRRRRSPADFLPNRGHRSCHHRDAMTEKETKSHHQQTMRHAVRPCLACDNPDAVRHSKKGDHEECNHHYKMAFKAGVPISTPVKNRTAAASKPARHLKVPKPKTTNSDKKKYVIGTLLPPFSMWPGTTARDYPEHWRLTSVYRQAFKPLELRKQPLLQTVYL